MAYRTKKQLRCKECGKKVLTVFYENPLCTDCAWKELVSRLGGRK